MSNTTHIKMGSNTSNVVLNTPSHGMMQRSHPNSFFIRFAKGSTMEDWIFNDKGGKSVLKKKNTYGSYEDICEITILQIMVFGDIQYLCEVVRDSDLIDPVVNPGTELYRDLE